MAAPPKPAEAVPTPDRRLYPVIHWCVGRVVAYGGGVDVGGLEHLPRGGLEGRATGSGVPGSGVIVAGTHALAMDPFTIGYAIPPALHRLQFMAKRDAFEWRVIGPHAIGPVLRATGAFPVDRSGRDPRALRQALRVLRRGGMVGIFPQGTRNGQGLHGGAALLALKAGVPIVPVRVWHDRPAWLPRGLPGGRWHVRFGPPLHPHGDSLRGLTLRWENAVAVL